MADTKMHAGIRFNDPVANYMNFDMDMTTMKLTVYITGEVEGKKIKSTGTITKWFPVVQEG